MSVDTEDRPVAGGEPSSAGTSKRRSKLLLLNLGVLVIVLLVGGYLWKTKSDQADQQLKEALGRVEQLEKAHAEQAAAAATRMESMLQSNAESLIRLSAIPLAWAIRAELSGGNLQRAETYVNEFARERMVKSILLADAKGGILLASDKALEKRKFEDVYPLEYLKLDAPAVQRAEGGSVRLVVPIMGMTARAATLVVTYAPTTQAEAAK